MMRHACTALFYRECAAIAASRVVWVFILACGLGGLAVGMGDAQGSTAVWLALPLVLYLIPLIGLLVGVSAARGDREEEPLLAPRAPSPRMRLAVKWVLWSALLGLVALAWLLPAVVRAGRPDLLPVLWLQTLAEAGVFVAFGLAIGRLVRDSVAAHLSALVLGCFLVAGAGVLGWLAARSPFFQENPVFWTLGLMLHPVEALRISLMFSVENLPFDSRHLPDLAAWWLEHPGQWYAALALAWSALALLVGGWVRSSGTDK